MAAPKSRRCRRCEKRKRLHLFSVSSGCRYGHSYTCRACAAAATKRWYKKRDKVKHTRLRRNAHLRRQFGMTLDEYNALLKAQGGVCAICRKPEKARHRSGTVISLAVDHSHGTKGNRGLLCHNCNRGIGYLGDDPAILTAACKYILEWER